MGRCGGGPACSRPDKQDPRSLPPSVAGGRRDAPSLRPSHRLAPAEVHAAGQSPSLSVAVSAGCLLPEPTPISARRPWSTHGGIFFDAVLSLGWSVGLAVAGGIALAFAGTIMAAVLLLWMADRSGPDDLRGR